MTKVLIYSQDVIGKTMAGPGIRYWEFAKALSDKYEVTLASPNVPDLESDQVRLICYEGQKFGQLLKDQDVVISQVITPTMAYVAKKQGIQLILDAYDPILLENLEVYSHETLTVQRSKNKRFQAEMEVSILAADAFICASEKQRDLWIGALMGLGRITPDEYKRDVSLRKFIDVVPFGVQDTEPTKTDEGFRKRLGIKDSDTVLLWGGGIWNWFDPLTLIRAVGKISKDRDDIKLVFMGLKHPNEHVKEMEMARKAVDLAKELGLYENQVFFNYGWVEYDKRQNHFLEANIGVSTHFDHLETRFSFRTRILDYFWTKLPIICTTGDSMAELVGQEQLGLVVGYEDVDDLAKQIVSLADNRQLAEAFCINLGRIREDYRWKQVVTPIIELIDSSETKARKVSFRQWIAMFGLYLKILGDVRSQKGLWFVVTNVWAKFYKLTFHKI